MKTTETTRGNAMQHMQEALARAQMAERLGEAHARRLSLRVQMASRLSRKAEKAAAAARKAERAAAAARVAVASAL